LLKFLHHLCLVVIILVLSLFEVSESVRLCSSYAETVTATESTPWQGNDRLEKANFQTDKERCKNTDNPDCIKSKNFDKKDKFFGLLTKKALDRWLSGFVMFIISVVSIGAAYTCIGGVRSGMMNKTCAWTAVPLAIGGLAYLAGEIGLYIKTKDNLMGSFNYNQEDLDNWSEFCLKYNSYSSRNAALAGLRNGELEDLKPRHSENLFNNESPQPFEVYCDQVAMVQRQKMAFESLKSGLEFKKNLTITAISSFGLAGVIELVQAVRQGAAKAEDKSDLLKLLTCLKKQSATGITKAQKLETSIIADMEQQKAFTSVDTTLNTMAKANVPKLKGDLANINKVKLLCLQPMQKCAETLEKTYAFHVVYGKKKAVEGTSPVSGSDGLMCLKDYTEFTAMNDYSRQACYFAMAGCENVGDSFGVGTVSTILPGNPGGTVSYKIKLAQLSKEVSAQCIREFIKKEESEGKFAQLNAGECSLGDVSNINEKWDELNYQISGEILTSKDDIFDEELFLALDNKAVDLQQYVSKVKASEKLTEDSKILIQEQFKEMMELQKSMEELQKLQKATTVEAIETARDSLYQRRLAENKIADACVQSCINGENENPTKPKRKGPLRTKGSFLSPDNGVDELNSPEAKEFFSSIEKMMMVLVASATAGENFEMNKTKSAHWWSAIPFALALIAVFFKVFSSFMRFYYQTPLSRSIWIAALGGLAWWNLSNLNKTVEEMDKFIGELDHMVDSTRVDLEVNVAGANVNAVNQSVTSSFESNAAVEFQDRNLGVKLPCPAGGDGRGGCKKTGRGLKATLKALEINGLAGMSNSMSELGDELGGASSISSNALQASSNLNNAIKKIDTVRDRLMKKLNKQRSKLGQPPFNPAPAAKRLTAALKSAVINSKAPELTAALGGDALAKAKEEINAEQKDLLKMLKDKKAEGVEEKGKTDDFMSGLKFDFKSNEQPASGVDFDMEEERSKVSGLDIKMDDISGSSSANIFKVISTRYLKSAYPKLLEQVD